MQTHKHTPIPYVDGCVVINIDTDAVEAKRIRNPLSEEAERKLKAQVVQLTKERDEALQTIDLLRDQSVALSGNNEATALAAHVATGACRRYEQRWIRDERELTALRTTAAETAAALAALRDSYAHTKKGYETTLHDMEDELEWMRGKEKLLEANAASAAKTSRQLRVRLQAETERGRVERGKVEAARDGMATSLGRVSEAMHNLQKDLFAAKAETRHARAEAAEDARRSGLRQAWMRAACLSVCKRLHAVRRVAKIHKAWWNCVHRERAEQHSQTIENIKGWEVRLRETERACAEMCDTVAVEQAARRKSDVRATVLATGNWCLLCTVLGKAAEIAAGQAREAALKKDIWRLERVILSRDARVQASYTQLQREKERANDVEKERMKVWTALRKALHELDEKDDTVRGLSEKCDSVAAEGESQLRRANAFLVESDRENKQMGKDRETLRQALGQVIRRVFSSECRRVELEQSFGSLSKPSPQLASLLMGAGFDVGVKVPVHQGLAHSGDARMRRARGAPVHLHSFVC